MLGQNINRIRKVKNMTQKDLAEKCDLSARTIQNYEQETRYPRYDQMEQIAKALEVSTSDLLMVKGNVELKTSELFLSRLSDEIEEHEWKISDLEHSMRIEKDKLRWKISLLKEIERITGKTHIDVDDTIIGVPEEEDVPFDDAEDYSI